MRRHLCRYAYGYIVLILFLGSLTAHFSLAMWNGDDLATWAQEVFENWESEFLQLLVQVVGLAWFLHVGSPASKESGERLEAKIDFLLSRHDGGDETRATLDRRHMRT